MTPADLQATIDADVAAYREAIERDPNHWWLRHRSLPDGRVLYLHKLPRFYVVSIGPANWPLFDSVYHYEAAEPAWRAILTWDGSGDPEGWYLNPQTGRRRPGGDPSKEYVSD